MSTQRIELLTNNGHRVAMVEIPPFAINPQVLLWGLRYFVRNANGEYREAVGVWYVSTDHISRDPSTTKGTTR